MIIHKPVLTEEVIKVLAPSKNQNFIDATVGFAGHAEMLLKKTAPNGKLLAIDQDSEALEKAKDRLTKFGSRVSFARVNFVDLGLIIRDWKEKKINGILFDLGPNTTQLLDEERGFSFRGDAPLDMRMNFDTKLTAADIVNRFSKRDIAKILFAGEEKFAKQIAAEIIRVRSSRPINTTKALVEVVRRALPPKYRFEQKTHFTTATFRALRMAVNDELNNLQKVLPQAVKILSPGGRIAVISFHSLEDRIVKNYFRDNPDLDIFVNKPITASSEEIRKNSSARSAKLRVAVKKGEQC